MTASKENLYKAPEANLVSNIEGEHPILKFKRFSTWGVFGLSLITMGYYNYHWLASRTKTANLVSEKQTSLVPIYIAVTIAIASLILTYGNFSPELTIMGSGLSLVGACFMLYSIFALRNRLVEISNIGSANPEKMGGIKTFFLTTFFLNYRINKNIDLQRNVAAATTPADVELQKAA